jgi:hypothetical protein
MWKTFSMRLLVDQEEDERTILRQILRAKFLDCSGES